MNRTFALASLAIFVVGCNSNNGSSNSTSLNGDTNTNSSNQTSVSAVPQPSTSSTGTTSSDANKPNAYGVRNPDRIFQTENLEVTTIKTPKGDLKLWVMDNEDKRREGMMFLRDNEVKDNEGMIFVFPKVQLGNGNYAFWMHNTILPLDIDYISKDKKILNVGVGKPMNDDPVKPGGDYFYVIELKQGMSAKYGLVAGSKVEISDSLKGKP